MRYLINQFLRIFEKIPGINLLQVLEVDGIKFLLVPKVGTRTIRDHFLHINNLKKGDEWYHIKYLSPNAFKKYLKYNHITIVTRDPLKRLHSCWKQKIYKDRDSSLLPYFWMYFPLIRNDMSFYNFLRSVKKISPFFSEKHFRPIFNKIDKNNSNIKLIKLEDLNNYLGIKSKKNATRSIIISELEKKYFYKNLSHRYQSDYE